MRELEAIREIEAGKPLANTEGLQLDLFVDYNGGYTTVIHKLVTHNRLKELKALLAGKTAAEIQSILDVGFGDNWPLQGLAVHIIFGNGQNIEFNYIDPEQYKELICFLLQNGVDTTLVTMYLLSKKAEYKGELEEVANEILKIMEECAPDAMAASRSIVQSAYETYAPAANTESMSNATTDTVLSGVVEYSAPSSFSMIAV